MSKILINQYRRDLETRKRFGGSHNEGSIRYAFATLLNGYCKPRDFALVEELTIPSRINTNIRLDGIVKDALRLDWGYWEAKDEKDSLDAEIEEKFKKGYPTDNILFEDTKQAVLIQNGTESLRIDMENDDDLDKLINQFLDYERAEVKDFRTAINSFSQDLPTILDTLRKLIDSQSESNNKFIEARDKFLKVCQESINPEINLADIREMIIQHILTEDIFNSIFNDAQFHQENNIAFQLNEVIKTFFTRDIKKNTFKTIQSYYTAIIRTASNIVNHHEKQKFLKVVYENFYKIYNPKGADRLGIVYTPNEIVKFMVESTDYLLDKHFNKSLGSKGVEILDPCTGTGTFITEILDYLLTKDIGYKYENEIHCNEVSILPYYIANLNIEYTFQQRTGEYLEFKNICLLDTLDNMGFGYEGKQHTIEGIFTEENTERIKRQNERKISVIIGNPPYNANQQNENDNNKNREYPAIDKRIKETYVKESTAQKTKLYDMYSRFLRWATDRLNDDGIIAFVSNSSFIDAKTYDGFRKLIVEDFNEIYIIDLKGNARNSGERRQQEGGNIFDDKIKVGIAVYFLVRNRKLKGCKVYYKAVDDYIKADDKLNFLSANKLELIDFELITPDNNNNWINLADENNFDELLPLVNKETKLAKNKDDEQAIFKLFSNGVNTARDEWVFDYNSTILEEKIIYFIDRYNLAVKNLDFDNVDSSLDSTIKWSADLKKSLVKKVLITYDKIKIVSYLYRPFTKKYYYSEKLLSDRLTENHYQMFDDDFQNKNEMITIPSTTSSKYFSVIVSKYLADFHFNSDTQCLPLYRYEKGERIENITDWGLENFRSKYEDKSITKPDIFNYVYGVLHNPEYREKYELNLKREFPRIPFYDIFWQWAEWGKQLMELHLNYETIKPYQLKRIDIPLKNELATPKPKLKADKTKGTIIVDEVTTLENVPAIAFEYKLGNRSAIEWILDQYKEKKPKDKTIAEKFNNYQFADYKEQVIDLLMRVTTVSVETMKIINQMNN